MTVTEPTTQLPHAGPFPTPPHCRTPSDCDAKTSSRPCRSCAATERARRINEDHASVIEDREYYRTSTEEVWKHFHAERAAHAKTCSRLRHWKFFCIGIEICCLAIIASFIFAVRP